MSQADIRARAAATAMSEADLHMGTHQRTVETAEAISEAMDTEAWEVTRGMRLGIRSPWMHVIDDELWRLLGFMEGARL